MLFRDRQDAGQQLAAGLAAYADLEDVVVLGIPRGGVSVAFEIAKILRAPMDIFLSRKLGVPGHEELAFGAIAADDGRFLDHDLIRAAGLSPHQVDGVIQATQAALNERARIYRGALPPLRINGRIAILVDDGIATGASVLAAISALRQMKPKKIIVAVPVAPSSTCRWLRSMVDELVVISAREDFYAVGQFYDQFSQVSDKEVIEILKHANALRAMDVTRNKPGAPIVNRHEVSIMVDGLRLEGSLGLPNDPKGIVVFAHGSGSSLHSPRNQYVARILHNHGLATLLFDLLSPAEESIDRRTAEFRFDIPLLAKRLIGVTRWVANQPQLKDLAIGYFGASTGAAAALVAGARLSGLVAAVASRGGRPDLAGNELRRVRAHTLLLVGSLDETVIQLNRKALAELGCQTKELVVIPGASHLFEEPGTLEEVARLTAQWMIRYLAHSENGAERFGHARSFT
jgi:putative phosphoribosyl transferase